MDNRLDCQLIHNSFKLRFWNFQRRRPYFFGKLEGVFLLYTKLEMLGLFVVRRLKNAWASASITWFEPCAATAAALSRLYGLMEEVSDGDTPSTPDAGASDSKNRVKVAKNVAWLTAWLRDGLAIPPHKRALFQWRLGVPLVQKAS